MAQWRFDTEEFAALWYGPGNDTFPFPFDYLSRFQSRNELDSYRRAVRERYAGHDYDELRTALTLVERPEIRAELVGFVGQRREFGLRGLACVHGQRAVVAAQRGVGESSGPPVIFVRTILAADLPAHLAAVAPKCCAGNRRGGRFHQTDIELDLNAPNHRVDPIRKSPRAQYRDLMTAPRALSASISVYAGPARDVRDPIGGIRFFDIEDDGRYLRSGKDPVVIQPAAATDIANALSSLVQRAVKARELDGVDHG